MPTYIGSDQYKTQLVINCFQQLLRFLVGVEVHLCSQRGTDLPGNPEFFQLLADGFTHQDDTVPEIRAHALKYLALGKECRR